MTRSEATFKIKSLLSQDNITYDKMAESLGITKPTLYSRLVKQNWKLGEIALIERL